MSAWLLELAVLAFGIVCGGMVYEHTAIVPVWAKAPPASLQMWQGPHRVRAERFWLSIHPIVGALLIAALATSWGATPVATRIAIALGGYVPILIATRALFLPELMRLTNAATGLEPAAWSRRARRWERLSLARGAVMLGLAVVLCDALRLA